MTFKAAILHPIGRQELRGLIYLRYDIIAVRNETNMMDLAQVRLSWQQLFSVAAGKIILFWRWWILTSARERRIVRLWRKAEA